MSMALLGASRVGAAFVRQCFCGTSNVALQARLRTSASRTRLGAEHYSDPYQESSLLSFSMDPESEQARDITSHLGLAQQQHDKLSDLSSLVVEWNEKINLISRKDCTKDVVFGRHVLPSVAMAALPQLKDDRRIIDVGTGGGFPGLPLAIAYPNAEFMLVDSIGKKIKVVQAMADELGLDNVQTHHGRAEELVENEIEGQLHESAYDVCVGRSVAALPKFCFWISDLLKKDEESHLLYIIGGDIQNDLLSKAESEIAIDDLLDYSGASDKRILTFSQTGVANIAAASGEKKKKRGKARIRTKPERSQRKTKGEWTKRDNAAKKQRGYDNFQRYEG